MKYKSKVSDVITRTLSVKSIRIEKNDNIPFKAGQFFKIFSDSESRYLSVSCSPERNYLEFTKRLTESFFSKRLDSLKNGEDVILEGPYGKFILDNQDEKLVFIAGGIGITPVFSILEDIYLKKEKKDCVLFYGNKRMNDIPFYDELKSLTSAINLRIKYFIEEESELDENCFCRGILDFIQINKELKDLSDRTVLICGPDKMVEKMLLEIKGTGLKTKIKTEKIIGYKGG